MTRRLVRDDGFTLPELMVAVTIMGIIMIALSASVILGMRSDTSTRVRFAESHDSQFLSVFFPPDVQSTSSDIVAAPTANTECSGVANLVRMKWTEKVSSSASTDTFVAAYAIAQSGAEWHLVRSYCTNGGPAQQFVVARNIKPSCAAPDCVVTINGRRVSMKLTGASSEGYTYTVSGERRIA